jgi:hypothetical protein
MTRLGWFEGFILLAFWIGGLTAFLVGGLVAVGQVLQAFLVVVFWWVVRELYREYYETLKMEHYKNQVFADWAKRQKHLKGME